MLLMTSLSLPSSLYIFVLKGEEREGSFIHFFQVDLDFSSRGVFTTWAVHVRSKNWDFGQGIIGKDTDLTRVSCTCERVALTTEYTSNWNY